MILHASDGVEILSPLGSRSTLEPELQSDLSDLVFNLALATSTFPACMIFDEESLHLVFGYDLGELGRR
jgi:hypothetical protein